MSASLSFVTCISRRSCIANCNLPFVDVRSRLAFRVINTYGTRIIVWFYTTDTHTAPRMQAASGAERTYVVDTHRGPPSTSHAHAPLAPVAQNNSCSSRSIHQQLVTGQYRARRRQLLRANQERGSACAHSSSLYPLGSYGPT